MNAQSRDGAGSGNAGPVMEQPGHESAMTPKPESSASDYRPSRRLDGKVALITGGDSGIGRSVAVSFAKEGAHVSIVYLDEHEDARRTAELVEREGVRCLLLAGDAGEPGFAAQAVKQTVDELGALDILVNNAAEQHTARDIAEVSREQLEQTFRTNFFALFDFSREAVAPLPDGGTIINTTSVTAYRGSERLLDYAATKGAIVSFTRSLAKQLVGRKIRVNAVAPGPVWTPLIPASFSEKEIREFGRNVPMGRPAQPDEISPCYVFLASQDASYFTGQVLHPNGGEAVGS